MRGTRTLICSVIFFGCASFASAQTSSPKPVTALGAPVKPAPAASPAILPDSFAGWVAANPLKTITDPGEADSTNAEALKEYDFTSATLATYKRSGETVTLRALRFHDASGAYGAYTFYRGTGWPKADIGAGGAANHNRVLFWIGNTVVDANYSQIGPMSGSELRELAKQFPLPDGNRAVPPPILGNLPKDSIDGQTTHYAIGPAGYTGSGGVLPADVVGFDRGAEAMTANYSLRSGPATLTIIDYPTPQMAAAQESKIRAYLKVGSQALPPWPKPLIDSDQASLDVRRSGPLVAIVSGDAIPDESHKLLASVHYDAELITIPQPGESEVAKTGKLLLGIAALVIIGCSAALLLGFFLGGGRALYRIARGKPASSVYEAEFIRLDLREEWVDSAASPNRPHPKG